MVDGRWDGKMMMIRENEMKFMIRDGQMIRDGIWDKIYDQLIN